MRCNADTIHICRLVDRELQFPVPTSKCYCNFTRTNYRFIAMVDHGGDHKVRYQNILHGRYTAYNLFCGVYIEYVVVLYEHRVHGIVWVLGDVCQLFSTELFYLCIQLEGNIGIGSISC
jgi:hypothetical protein